MGGLQNKDASNDSLCPFTPAWSFKDQMPLGADSKGGKRGWGTKPQGGKYKDEDRARKRRARRKKKQRCREKQGRDLEENELRGDLEP